MIVNKAEAKTYICRAFCEECQEEMKEHNFMLMSSPPKYTYICPKCKKEETSTICYPQMKYSEEY